jgi:hypothetical protein
MEMKMKKVMFVALAFVFAAAPILMLAVEAQARFR